MKKIGFLEEEEGVRSITRLGFAAMILCALYISIYEVMTVGNFNIPEFVTIVSLACTLKLGSKQLENNETKIFNGK